MPREPPRTAEVAVHEVETQIAQVALCWKKTPTDEWWFKTDIGRMRGFVRNVRLGGKLRILRSRITIMLMRKLKKLPPNR